MATAQAMREQEKTVSVSLSYKEKLCLHFVCYFENYPQKSGLLLWPGETETYFLFKMVVNLQQERMLANKRKKLMIKNILLFYS